MRSAALTLVLLIGGHALPVAAAEVAAVSRVLLCGRLLDVTNQKVREDQAVVVEGDRVASVGPADRARIPDGAETIDLRGYTCLPGLIDAHTHLVDRSDDQAYNWANPLMTTGAEMAFHSIPNARKTLLAGFTTVRDLGTYRAFIDVALRDAIERGTVPGPRMQPAGAYVTISGGAGALTGFAPDVELPLELRFGQADGPDQVRQRVREIARRGAGVIKVLATGAILTLGSRPGGQEFTYEELRAAVEEAAKNGLKVAAHAHSPEGAEDAVRAGVASIEHGSLLDDDALLLMKEHGTFLMCDALASWDFWPGGTPDDAPDGYPPEFVEKEKVSYAGYLKTLRRAIELDVRIAFGTDAAVIPHGQNARLFRTYVEAGMTPWQALRTATVEAAELLGWQDRVGAVEAGRFADVVAVAGDPLADISLLEDVAFVMKGGTVYKGPPAP
ncbi:MAG: amidohydrolase family protein [Xanthomonadales bacterium]|nr:amidohydrolase family protein [Xanthomonadales bacterium]